MGLDRAIIRVERTGVTIPVQFNPEEYSVDTGNSYSEMPVPGRPVTPIQYVRGDARRLTLELFFDTSGTNQDVRRHTEPIVGLLRKDPATGGPPILVFGWGTFQMRCVLEKVGQQFTRFMADGLPIRASLSVSFREYEPVALRRSAGLFLGSPMLDQPSSTRTGPLPQAGAATVSGVAAAALGDPSDWRVIAELNGVDNPRMVVTSRLLTPLRRT